jgi:hypothetical protein
LRAFDSGIGKIDVVDGVRDNEDARNGVEVGAAIAIDVTATKSTDAIISFMVFLLLNDRDSELARRLNVEMPKAMK